MPKLRKSLVTPRQRAAIPPPFVSDYPGRAKLKTITLPPSLAVSVEFPFGPKNISYDSLEITTTEIQRPNKKPILAISNPKLATVSFTALIADKQTGGMVSDTVQDVMDKLNTIAASGYQCKFTYGLTALNYAVVISRLSFTVQQVNGNGEPIRVEANIQLTEAPFFSPEIVQLNVVYNRPEVVPTVQTEAPADVPNPETNYLYSYGGEKITKTTTVDGQQVREIMRFV